MGIEDEGTCELEHFLVNTVIIVFTFLVVSRVGSVGSARSSPIQVSILVLYLCHCNMLFG